MKIIITEEQYRLLTESKFNNSKVIEQILNDAGIEFSHCGFGGRSYDNFHRKIDTVYFWFTYPNTDVQNYKRIHYITRNNKVVSVDSSSDFRTLHYGFEHIPEKKLMDYFIEKGKTYLEKILPYEYPNDSL